MSHSLSKLISIVLIFLLAVAPLQSVSAGTDTPTQDSMENCHKVMGADYQDKAVNSSSPDCEQCSSHQTCDESCCNTGICASASMALMPNMSTTTIRSSTTHNSLYANGILQRYSHGPYRPPRA